MAVNGVLEDQNHKIQIGEGYQAELPDVDRVEIDEPRRGFAEQIWSASRSAEKLGIDCEDIEDFVAKVKEVVMQARPPGAMAIHVDASEYLAELHFNNYDIDKALNAIASSLDRFVHWWHKDENEVFQALFEKHGNNLIPISHGLPQKTSQALVARFQRARADKRRESHRTTTTTENQSLPPISKRPKKRQKVSATKLPQELPEGPQADDPKEIERIARLFLQEARNALAPDSFKALLHLLRMYDQHIIDESALLDSCFELLQDQTAVREAFLYFAQTSSSSHLNSTHKHKQDSPAQPKEAIIHPGLAPPALIPEHQTLTSSASL